MKGIILAGGSGSRLFPLTKYVSKQLLPIYDKPMIYYPLSTLMLGGIREILIISDEQNINAYKKLFGNGSQFGINLSYCVQQKPNGIAEAFILGEEFIGNDNVTLILGDNIFHGENLQKLICSSINIANNGKSVIVGHKVPDPERYGVAVIENEKVIEIQEKPNDPKSDVAIVGLYFYTNDVISKAKYLKPSKRGELEITDLNNLYIKENLMEVSLMEEGFTWLDTGTFNSLMQAGQFVQVLEERQGLKVGCIEEVAWRKKFITDDELEQLALPLQKSGYGKYLLNLLSKDS